MHLAQAVVLEHQEYLEAVRELTDWLMTAGEELQHWSDTSGDSSSIRKKLSEVRVSWSDTYKTQTITSAPCLYSLFVVHLCIKIIVGTHYILTYKMITSHIR